MKNYLVIGGSSGIGKSLSNILSKHANVTATYYSNADSNDTTKINYQFLDVMSDEVDLKGIPDELHGLAYCPGSINLKPFRRIKISQYRNDFDLQVMGAVKVIQQYLPNLISASNSSILLFSTVAVQQGFSYHSQVSISKGAIEGLTRSLAAELSPGIRVNAIAPSLTNTPLAAKLLSSEEKVQANAQRHPLKSIGDPDNIAELAAFLLTDKAKWITGQILHADGGMSSIKL